MYMYMYMRSPRASSGVGQEKEVYPRMPRDKRPDEEPYVY